MGRPAVLEAAGPVTIYELADQSELVGRAEVQKISSVADGRFVIYRLALLETFKGDLGLQAVELVQDRRPGKPDPLLLSGEQRFLLFAHRLPPYTLYRKSLPAGHYWEWAESYPVPARIVELSDREAATTVKGYIASKEGGKEAEVAFVSSRLSAPAAWIRQESIAWLAAEDDLADTAGKKALEEIGRYLSSADAPAKERARLIEVIAGKEMASALPLLKALLGKGSGVAGAALKARVRLGRSPDIESLLDYSRSEDSGLRGAAAYALARQGGREALERLETMVLTDPELAVRISGIEGLAFSPQGVGILEKALAQGNREIKLEVGESLLRIHTDEALQVLIRQLSGKDEVAAAVAVFTLVKWKSEAAIRALVKALESDATSESVRGLIRSVGRRPPTMQ